MGKHGATIRGVLKAAFLMYKVLSSAIANAGLAAESEDLKVIDTRVDRGPALRRGRFGPRGMFRPA